MNYLCLLLSMQICFAASESTTITEFVGLKWERKLMDAISDEMVWQGLKFDQPDKIKLITSDYYDTQMVSRSNEWLMRNVTWIVGITKDVPYAQVYQFGLIGRTIHILNDHYADNPNVRFGMLDYTKEELLKMTMIGDSAPAIAMFKDGYVYRLPGMNEQYHLVHRFIEQGYLEVDPSILWKVSGRWSYLDLYSFYIIKEMRNFQRTFGQ